MRRSLCLATFLSILLCAVCCPGEIVKVTADKAHVYDPATKQGKAFSAKGKRFMVYGARQGWYLVEATLNHEKKLVWLAKADVEIDWGQTKTARVVKVQDTNTLELEGDEWVRFAGLVVTRPDTPLTRRTLAWLKQLLEGKEVRLEYDKKFKKNQYGYGLVYVYVDGTFVNRTLVEYGLARMLSSYSSVRGRYVAVYSYFEEAAKEKGLGIWAGQGPSGDTQASTTESEAEAEQPSQPEEKPPRTLSAMERAQWARNLTTEVKVSTRREKTKIDEPTEDDDSSSGSQADDPSTELIKWTKTLSVTAKNGWGWEISGLTIRYELFAKTGRTSDTVIMLKAGELEPIDLQPGESQTLACEPVDFVGKDSSQTGWSGHKYYGYRVTFSVEGTVVKVVAQPESLLSFETGIE